MKTKRLKNEKRISFRISEPDLKVIERIAKKREIPISQILREAVKNFLLYK